MALQAAWTEAAEGRLPASEQAKLWALREVLGKLGESTTQYDWMSKQVHVMGKGGAKGDHPGRAAVKNSLVASTWSAPIGTLVCSRLPELGGLWS